MTKLFAFCSFLFLCFASVAQNLVPNPSFEEYENGCPENFNEMPIGWEWWRQSPNSFSTCVVPESASDSLGWAPNNGFGYQEPFDGESYIGIYGFGSESQPNYREYLGIELFEPLEIGIEYCVSFKTSLGVFSNYDMRWACSHIGVLFTERSYAWKVDELEIPNFAHVYTEEIVVDTTNWIEIQGSFIADEEYSHIGLGVFFDASIVDTLNLFGSNSIGAYYFIDDVLVYASQDCSDHNSIIETLSEIDLHLVKNQIHINTQLSNYALDIYRIDGVLVYAASRLSFEQTLTLDGILGNDLLIAVIKHDNGIESRKLMYFD